MKHYKNKYQPKPDNDVFLNGKYVGEAKEINIEYEPYEVWHDTYVQPITITDMGKSKIEVVFEGGTLEYDSNVADIVVSHKDEKNTKIVIVTKGDNYEGMTWHDNGSKWFSSAFEEFKFSGNWLAENKNFVTKEYSFNPASEINSYHISYHQHYSAFNYYGKSLANYQVMAESSRDSRVDKLPGLREYVKNPVNGFNDTLERTIIRLNDQHGWSREQIADWLETLDVNIAFKVDVNEQD